MSQMNERQNEREMNYTERCYLLHMALHENHTDHHMWKDCDYVKDR